MIICISKRSLPKEVTRLKKRILTTPRRISIERASLMTESFQQTEGEPIIIRRAKALRHVLNNMQINIDHDELIVGSRTIFARAGITFPECSITWLDNELESIGQREQEPFTISEEDKKH